MPDVGAWLAMSAANVFRTTDMASYIPTDIQNRFLATQITFPNVSFGNTTTGVQSISLFLKDLFK